MRTLRELEAWFVTGSQHLYGPSVLHTVEEARMSVDSQARPTLSPAAPP